ncbi:MAG: class I SAM-dependent methyltransferase [Verrucomicrobiota bacterium]
MLVDYCCHLASSYMHNFITTENDMLKEKNTSEDASKLLDSHISSLYEGRSGCSFDSSYIEKHRSRFLKTFELAPSSNNCGSALELGATALFQVALREIFGYSEVVGTDFSHDIEKKIYKREFSIGGRSVTNLSISLDIESDLMPYEAEKFDFVLCSEVIEHMDIDPMFMLLELNRVMKWHGKLLITTPNCCSARNFWKIAHGYRPHFFMQYEKTRSPYRHNIEYDVQALLELTYAAGFDVVRVETHDVFEDTVPEALKFLTRHGLPTENRGDDIFLLVEKVSEVRNRWPSNIYV